MAIQTDALAHVYARSLYELAFEAGGDGKVAEIADELEQIGELARGDREFREFLASPIVGVEKRADAIRQIFQDRITDLTLRFLLVLNDKGRLGHFESIGAAYDAMVQEARGKIEVDVFTAGPLGDAQADLIAQRIKDAIGKDPVLHRYTDDAMIGGVKLRIGDQLIDGSIAAQLRSLRQDILVNGSAAMRDRYTDIIDVEGDAP